MLSIMILIILKFANACLFSGHMISAAFKRDSYNSIVCKKGFDAITIFSPKRTAFHSNHLFCFHSKTNTTISPVH